MSKNNLHVILTGKGGCGKSYVASLLSQHIQKEHNNLLAFDTDNENPTLTAYKSLRAQHIQLLDSQRVLIRRNLDSLFNVIATLDDCNVVVDNGASSFSPLLGYLLQTDMLSLLKEELGWRVVIHTIVAGGAAFKDTVDDFKEVSVLNTETILWLNQYWGEDIGFSQNDQNEPFIQSDFFKQHAENVAGIVVLPRWSDDLFGSDIQQMQRDKFTLDDVVGSERYSLTSKLRLRKVVNDVFCKLRAAGV